MYVHQYAVHVVALHVPVQAEGAVGHYNVMYMYPMQGVSSDTCEGSDVMNATYLQKASIENWTSCSQCTNCVQFLIL